MKILFLSYIPSPYRVEFFNQWGKHCDLTVVFEKTHSSWRDNSWKKYVVENFEAVYLEGKGNPDIIPRFSVKKYLRPGLYDMVIVHNALTPTGMYAIKCLRKKKIPYFLEADGGFAKSGRGFKEYLKRHFLSNAYGYLSTGKMLDEYYLTYGADRNKLQYYPFTSVKDAYILDAVIPPKQKCEIRKKLGFQEEKLVIYVGRVERTKGIDILLKASVGLPKNVGVCIIGGECTEEYQKLKDSLGLGNVYFKSFVLPEKLQEYYKAADIFVFPTRMDVWGLVVNEAAANGLPIITTDACGAGIELVHDYENGFIVPVDDVQAIKSRMLEMLEDSDMLLRMGQSSLQKSKEFTIEKMVEAHIKILGGKNE